MISHRFTFISSFYTLSFTTNLQNDQITEGSTWYWINTRPRVVIESHSSLSIFSGSSLELLWNFGHIIGMALQVYNFSTSILIFKQQFKILLQRQFHAINFKINTVEALVSRHPWDAKKVSVTGACCL